MSVVNIGWEDFHLQSKVFIQEVNFVSEPIGPVTLAGGLFYMHKREAYDPFQVFTLPGPDCSAQQRRTRPVRTIDGPEPNPRSS